MSELSQLHLREKLKLEFRDLSVFLDICQTQSVSKTADRLNRKKSQISSILKNIETALQLKLISREHKKVRVNEQGLVLGRYIFLVAILYEFSVNQTCDSITDIKVFHLRVPLRSFNGPIQTALYKAIRKSQEAYPNVFICLEFSDSYSENMSYEPTWLPPWKSLGSLSVDYAIDRSAETVLTSTWVLVSHKASNMPETIHAAELRSILITLPRMPWLMLKQIANHCLANGLTFEYDSSDYTQLLMTGLGEDQNILMPDILLDEEIKKRYRISQLKEALSISLEAKSMGNQQFVDAFITNFSSSLKNTNDNECCWQPRATLRQIIYLLSVFKERSLTKASDTIYLSQPALSSQIKKLESIVGFPLFKRSMGLQEIEENSQSSVYHDIAMGIDEYMGNIHQYIGAQTLLGKGALGIGIIPSIDQRSRLMDLIINKVDRWQRQYPDIRIEIMEERHHNLISDLRRQKMHLAITEADSPWTTQKPLGEAELIGLICKTGGGLDRYPQLTWQQLTDYPLILPRNATGMRSLIDSHCLRLGIALRPEIESDSLNINRSWLISGRYATILPKSAVKSLIEDGLLTFIPLYPALYRTLKLTYLKHRILSPHEISLLNFLTDKG